MATTDSDTLNYRGELYLIGANQTPFLNMIGGLNGGRRSGSFTFPIAVPWALSSASQNVQSEDTAASAGTPTTFATGQDVNVCQIMKYDSNVTFKKQSVSGQMSGVNNNDPNPITDALGFQKMGALRQGAIDLEYSFLNGTYVAESSSATAVATRGIITAATTNTVNASSAALTKGLVDNLFRTMAGNGAQFQNPVIFVNAFQKQKLSDIYGFAPSDRNIGGVNVQTIYTDFAQVGVTWAPQVPAGTLLVADVAFVEPVFVPVLWGADGPTMDMEAGGDVIWVPTATTAAAYGGFWYMQPGLDYGPEKYHGTITNLATS